MPPSLIMTVVRTGLSFMFDRSTARSIAAATSSAPAVTVGTKLNDQSVDAVVGQNVRDGVPRMSCPSQSRARRSGWRGWLRGRGAFDKRGLGARLEGRELEPGGVTRIGAEIPSPPAFVSTATRRPRGSGCVERSTAVSISSESVPARMTPACANSASTAASEPARAAVWELAARAPALVVPLFIARIGFFRATRRAIRAEPERVSERLEIEHHDVGIRVVLPVLEQVVGRHVRLVADRDERGEPEASLVRAFQHRQPERAALRREPTFPGRNASRPERRIESGPGYGDPEAVRADQARTVGAGRARAAVPGARRLRGRSRRSPPRSRTALLTPARRAASAAPITASPGRQMTARSTLRRNLLDRVVAGDAGDRLVRRGSPGRRRPRSPRAGCCGRARLQPIHAWERRRRPRRRGSEKGPKRLRDGDMIALVYPGKVRLGRSDLEVGPPRHRPRAPARRRSPHPRTLASSARCPASPPPQTARSRHSCARPASCSSRRVPSPCPCNSSATANATSAVETSRRRV